MAFLWMAILDHLKYYQCFENILWSWYCKDTWVLLIFFMSLLCNIEDMMLALGLYICKLYGNFHVSWIFGNIMMMLDHYVLPWWHCVTLVTQCFAILTLWWSCCVAMVTLPSIRCCDCFTSDNTDAILSNHSELDSLCLPSFLNYEVKNKKDAFTM